MVISITRLIKTAEIFPRSKAYLLIRYINKMFNMTAKIETRINSQANSLRAFAKAPESSELVPNFSIAINPAVPFLNAL